MAIVIVHPVILVPQPTNMSCWSAAATMLFGNQSIAEGSATLGPQGGLNSDDRNIRLFAASHRLLVHGPQSWTVEGIASLLRRGPLWVGGRIPHGHAYVIGALAGDGTPEGTMITIFDPWPPGKGEIRIVSYSSWMTEHPEATDYVLHR